MELTARDREFLEAVAQDKLPQFDTLGALRRAARRLIREGLLDSSPAFGGDWTRYSLTQAGRDRLAGERHPVGVSPFDRPAPTLAQQTQYMVDAVNNRAAIAAEHRAG